MQEEILKSLAEMREVLSDTLARQNETNATLTAVTQIVFRLLLVIEEQEPALHSAVSSEMEALAVEWDALCAREPRMKELGIPSEIRRISGIDLSAT